MIRSEPSQGHPVRRCASCRSRHEASRLIRLVVGDDGEISVDLERKAPGRGLNLCPDPRCMADAFRKNVFMRSLGIRPTAKPEELMERVNVSALGVLTRTLRDLRAGDGVSEVASGHERPAAYAELRARLAKEGRSGALPAVALQNPRIAARVTRLAVLVNRFTFDRPGAKTRRPGPEHHATDGTAVSARVSGEL